MENRLREYARGFYLDVRSIALFRVGLALCVIADIAFRARDTTGLYSDAGALPRSAVFEHVNSDWYFSLNFVNGSPWFQAAIFALMAASAALLLVGVRTRVACLVVWLLVLSVQFRNPFLSEGFDVYVRLLLFWACLIPLDGALSLKRAVAGAPRRTDAELSAATGGFILQVLSLYVFSAVYKLEANRWTHGIAIQRILESRGILARPLGNWLSQFGTLLHCADYVTIALELGVPLLFLAFPKSPFVRLAMIGSLGLMHLGIWLTMDVDILPPVCIAALCAFLPSPLWDRLETGPAAKAWRRWASAFFRGLSQADAGLRRLGARYLAGRATSYVAVAAIALVGWMNVAGVVERDEDDVHLPEPLATLVRTVRLNQKWALFVGGRDERQDQYAVVGKYADGQRVNLMNGRAFDGRPAARAADLYSSHRWARFFIYKPYESSETGAHIGDYLCGLSSGLAQVEIWNFPNPRFADPHAPAYDERYVAWRHDCATGTQSTDGAR